MTTESLNSFYTILSLIVIIMIFVTFYIIHKKHVEIVKQHSSFYMKLLFLNSRYNFYADIPVQNRYNEVCRSKKSFDRLELNSCFICIIENNLEYFRSFVEKIQHNQACFKVYCAEYEKLSSTTTKEEAEPYRVPYNTFLKIEKNLYKKNKLHPILDTSVSVHASYTSPKGQNSYKKSHIYQTEEILFYYNRVRDLIKAKGTREYQVKVERSKMSDSLRYEVLKRDNHRCRICGASAQDGAKLHVDHIFPVSKGGKTSLYNLQTLCDRCNMGKSNKY